MVFDSPSGDVDEAMRFDIWGRKGPASQAVSDSVLPLVIRALSVSVYVCMCVSMCSIALFRFALADTDQVLVSRWLTL